MSIRILVTGSRDWSDRDAVWTALNRAASECGSILVHGACPTGADALADEWATTQPDIYVERHPADWSRGRGAGPERNRHMVGLGADVCLAFIGSCTSPRCKRHPLLKHYSHGASGTADMAEAAGIPVIRFHE